MPKRRSEVSNHGRPVRCHSMTDQDKMAGSTVLLVHCVHYTTGQYFGLECSVSSKHTPWGHSYIIGFESHYRQNNGEKLM
jgi:hypothetical protein